MKKTKYPLLIDEQQNVCIMLRKKYSCYIYTKSDLQNYHRITSQLGKAYIFHTFIYTLQARVKTTIENL